MKLVILDRDGVINEDADDYIKSPDEWVPIPGSLEAIARLTHAGYHVVVVTNQSGVERGLFDIETLNRIHEKMHRLVQEAGGLIEAVFFCPDANDASPCRKPNPGMLLEVAARLRASLENVPFVCDTQRDIDAALAVGARPILVRTGKGLRTLEGLAVQVPVVDDLAAVVNVLLAKGD